MATTIERQQVEQWLAEGLSLRAIAQRLGLPSTTFWRQWQRLQREAATPVQAEVTEMPARPGPPTRPPEVHRELPAELQAIQQDLFDLVAWWRERQRPRVHPEVYPRATARWTVHVDVRWIQAVKQEAAREGEPIMAIVNRIFRRYFEGPG
jgi:Helix-turn-helix domain